MEFKISEIKGLNIISYALMALQVAVLIGIATILVSALGLVGMSTAASMVIMFILGLPLLILHYFSATDKFLKASFLGLIGNIAVISVAGIIWYVLPGIFDLWWLVPAAKVLMVASYLPLLLTLYPVYWGERSRLAISIRGFALSVNICFSVCIVILALIRMSVGDPFDIAIYGITVILDIIVFTLSTLLIVISPSFRPRYVFSILSLFMLACFLGDIMNLANGLRLGPAGIGSYSLYFYDFMFLFLVAGLLVYSFFKDDSKAAVEEANKELADMRHSMDDLLSQMPDAACMFSPEGFVQIVNEPFLRLFGVKRDDMLGKYNLFSHAPPLKCDFKEQLRLLKEGRAVYMDSTKIAQHGSEVFISFKIFPTFSVDGNVSSYIAICEDVTARVHAEEELKQAKSMAELYVDLMGHDINNMNQVGMGYLEIALDTIPFEDAQKSLLLKPLEAMTNSSRLIDNVKKLRRASKGDMYLRPMDLRMVLKEVIAEHSQVPGRNVEIVTQVPEGTMVTANELLKDVFVNLVGNAIKHSGGIIRIIISIQPFEVDGSKYYRVFVEDNGPGISDEMKPLIFDRLMRSRSRTGGSGIGLYLVKTLLDSYGGSICVEDRVPGDRKQGARFIVTLPAA